MRQPRIFCLVILLAWLIGAAAHAMRMETVAFPPQTVPGSRMPTQPIPGILELPDGKGPFPAIVVTHGCGGRAPSATRPKARSWTASHRAMCSVAASARPTGSIW